MKKKQTKLHNVWSSDVSPSHSSRKNLILNSKKSPASTQEVRNPKIGQQLGAQPTPRFRVMIEAMDRRRVRCRDRPIAALHFLLPTGDSRSGRRSFDSKLISLLPLDEVPVHVPLRRPRPLRFERLRVGGEGKADANLT